MDSHLVIEPNGVTLYLLGASGLLLGRGGSLLGDRLGGLLGRGLLGGLGGGLGHCWFCKDGTVKEGRWRGTMDQYE